MSYFQFESLLQLIFLSVTQTSVFCDFKNRLCPVLVVHPLVTVSKSSNVIFQCFSESFLSKKVFCPKFQNLQLGQILRPAGLKVFNLILFLTEMSQILELFIKTSRKNVFLELFI